MALLAESFLGEAERFESCGDEGDEDVGGGDEDMGKMNGVGFFSPLCAVF